MRWSIVAVAMLCGLTASLHADEVYFNNGDRLTGKIDSVEGGKLTLTSALAGKVTIDMKNVKTFSTDGPINVKLTDGTVIHEKIAAGPAGQIKVAPGGQLAAQNVSLADVKWVNFNDNWTGNIVAGGMLTRGNTDTDSLNLTINMTRKTEQDKTLFDAGFLYGREKVPGIAGKHETENDWYISGQYDYNFNPKLYAYANARVERDLIAGISLRLTPGGGAGYNFVDKPDFHANAEGGISWLYREYTHNGGTDETVAARLAYHIDKKFNNKVLLFHNFEYFPGLDSINDYFFNTDIGVRTTLTDKMFTEFKIREEYDSEPAPARGHNDTRFILGVGWQF